MSPISHNVRQRKASKSIDTRRYTVIAVDGMTERLCSWCVKSVRAVVATNAAAHAPIDKLAAGAMSPIWTHLTSRMICRTPRTTHAPFIFNFKC